MQKGCCGQRNRCRRQADFAGQRFLLRICPAARHFRGIDSAHPYDVSAGINSADIKRGNGTPGHVYPVAFIAAPLCFISNGILYCRPVNLQRFNANPLINHGIRLNNDISWRALLPWRNNADWPTINNRTGINPGVFIRIVSGCGNCKGAIVIIFNTHNTILLDPQRVRLNGPYAFRLWSFGIFSGDGDDVSIDALNGSALRPPRWQVQ